MTDLREIVLDTETTGLEPGEHRIVEIGALELVNHVPTGRTFHEYINPRRGMPAEAFAIHGISEEFLADKPLFEAIAQPFMDFIGDAMLVIHNAPFDVKFLNFELSRVNMMSLEMRRVTDTLDMARNRFPGAQNNLDALCRRFRIDSGKRVKHGALLDSELLADVYIEMIGGRQAGFSLDVAGQSSSSGGGNDAGGPAKQRGKPRPVLLTDAEREAHRAFIETLGDAPKWLTDKAGNA